LPRQIHGNKVKALRIQLMVAAAVLHVVLGHPTDGSDAKINVQSVPLRDPAKPGVEDILRVASFDDLEPRTSTEEALAKHVSRGIEKLRAPNAAASAGWFAGPLDPKEDPNAPADPDRPLRERVCGAGGIVVGAPSKRRVLLNEAGTWLITVYEVQVKSVLRPASLPAQITVAMPTAIVEVDGKVFRRGSQTLPALGRAYLWFVRAVPDSLAFMAAEPSEVQWPANSALIERLAKIRSLATECGQWRP